MDVLTHLVAETANPEDFASVLILHPELAIVQDADRLDAMGAIGIGRAFTYGGAHIRELGMAGTIDHFGTKLVNLEAKMKTEEGRRLAVVRSQRLRIFGRWWQEEMGLARAETGDMAWVQEVPPWVESAVFREGRLGGGDISAEGGASKPWPGPSAINPPNLPRPDLGTADDGRDASQNN